MGTGGTPTIPLFIGQGAFGELEWTPGDQPGIRAGDGVMIAGDVRTLARGYCANGTAVYYEEYEALSHITSIAIWLPNSTRGSRSASPACPRRRIVRRSGQATRLSRFRCRRRRPNPLT